LLFLITTDTGSNATKIRKFSFATAGLAPAVAGFE
jgi:hypothetical protein